MFFRAAGKNLPKRSPLIRRTGIPFALPGPHQTGFGGTDSGNGAADALNLPDIPYIMNTRVLNSGAWAADAGSAG